MFKKIFSTGFSDTDSLGHINNTKFPIWFENARDPIFKIFVPDMDPKKWNLILVKVEIDFLAQAFFGKDIEIQTFISKIGGSSFIVTQEAYQEGIQVACGNSTMVYFDYAKQTSKKIEGPLREGLSQLLN
jgi:acyl-CoA thioester hydrolase